MGFLRLLPALLCSWLMAAHFLRTGEWAATAGFAALPLVFLFQRRWVLHSARFLLMGGAAAWLWIANNFAAERALIGNPSGRLWLILGGVGAFHLLAAWLCGGERLGRWFHGRERTAPVSTGAFLLAFVFLAAIQYGPSLRLLLLDRFLPGGGWGAALVLSIYAAFVAEWLLDTPKIPEHRLRIWSFFSGVFFAQLILGLSGLERFLMTGKLHIPVPALIAAGPAYRGEGFFMLILFLVTIVFVGPAWCSHLCYIGVWDNAFSRFRRRPEPFPRWVPHMRWVALILVLAVAFGLRASGLAIPVAAGLAIAFGLAGVALMAFFSRRLGWMAHCTGYCPIGALATTLGKLNPFRLRIGHACTECNLCITACRYGALDLQHIRDRAPGPTCTLCGDCLSSCKGLFIHYRFPGLSPLAARGLFVALISAFHAVFLGVARI